MRDPLLLGVDVGTTNCKAAAYTPAGHLIAQARAATPVTTPAPGRAEHDANELWRAVAAVIRATVAQLPDAGYTADDIAALAVASMAEAGVLVDEDGRPLTPMIAWYDQRTLGEGRWWADVFGARRVFDITGQTPQPIYSLCKLMWLRRHLPDAFARAAAWLNVADWIAYRLTGEPATDLSLASRTLALDVTRRVWSAEMLDAAGVPAQLMARLVPSGGVVGRVTAEAAALTGLATGTGVAAGGHDHIVGAFGVGATEPGILLNSLGTAEAMVLALCAPTLTDALFEQRGHLGIHAAPDRYYTTGGVAGQGASLEWARELLAPGEPGEPGYRRLNALAAAAPPGSGGVVFLAHLRGAGRPHNDPTARGALVGLTPGASRATVARAVFEGMAFASRTLLESMEAATGVRAEAMLVIGGGARNPTWLQIRADVMQRPLRVVAVDEATAWGAAALAGLGAGVYADTQAMLTRAAFPAQLIAPNPAHADLYERAYRDIYFPLYAALRATNREIDRLGT